MSIIARLLIAAFVSGLVVIPTVFAALFAVHMGDFVQIDFINAEAAFSLRENFMDASGVAAFGVVIAWVANLFFGVPVYAFLRILDMAKPVPCALLGATTGLLAGYSMIPVPELYVVMMACGGSVAAVFCRVANVLRKPDRTETPGVWY